MGYGCMVPAMSGLLRSARPSIVALLTTALVLGINGFVGAIHSVHHLPAQAQAHDDPGHAHDEQGGAPADTPGETCPIDAAALQISATEVAALAALDPWPAETELVAPEPQDAPRHAFREPGSGRAPPSVRSLTS